MLGGLIAILAAWAWVDDLMEFILINGPKNTRWILRNFLLMTIFFLLVLNGFILFMSAHAKERQTEAFQNEVGIKINLLKNQLTGINMNGRHFFQEHEEFAGILVTNPVVGPATRKAFLDNETNLQALYMGVSNLNALVTGWKSGPPSANSIRQLNLGSAN